MCDHANPRPDESGDRRAVPRRAVLTGLATAAAAIAGGGALVAAIGTAVTGPADVDTTARRRSLDVDRPPPPPSGRVAFPLQPTDDCYVLDNFGDCRGSRLHEGIDILDRRGQPVFAVQPGVMVHRYENTGSAGLGWILRGDDGRIYRFFHLDAFTDGLVVGDRVAFGDVIGTVGSTGTSSVSNVHLHFEVRDLGSGTHWQSVPINPLPLLELPPGMRVGPPLRC
jgi:murein DD-endopeptidase MepM/ murein hydrolase activator NlpD